MVNNFKLKVLASESKTGNNLAFLMTPVVEGTANNPQICKILTAGTTRSELPGISTLLLETFLPQTSYQDIVWMCNIVLFSLFSLHRPADVHTVANRCLSCCRLVPCSSAIQSVSLQVFDYTLLMRNLYIHTTHHTKC